MTERRAVPQEVVDNRVERLNSRIEHSIGVIALIGESNATGRTVNALLSEQVKDGSLTRDDARERADMMRAIMHSAQVTNGGVDGAHDRTDHTIEQYRQGPVPHEDLATLEAAAKDRIDSFDRQIEIVQDRRTY